MEKLISSCVASGEKNDETKKRGPERKGEYRNPAIVRKELRGEGPQHIDNVASLFIERGS